MERIPKSELPGKEYEQIVAAIHRQFAGDAQVTENETITGKSGQPRQIDIAIRTIVDGAYPILIVVDCKDYRRRVGIEKVDELIGKIDDVQAVMGVLVSNSGFSEDATRRAAQEVRIQLASVVDLENERVRARVAIPHIFDFRAPQLQMSINATGKKSFAMDAEFVKGLERRFLEKWNAGRLDFELGDHQDTEVIQDEPDLKVSVTYQYTVTRRLLYGLVKLIQARGILNVTKGTFQTSGFTTEMISMADVERNWRRVDEDNVPFAVITMVATDVFPLHEDPGSSSATS